MRLLVSVRHETEALLAARGGADFIDLKEPREGALGGLPVATIRAIVHCLRKNGIGLPISATIGDLPMHDTAHIAARVEAVGECGVDYVKVGIEAGPGAPTVLQMLGASRFAIVPVFIADRGLNFDLVAQACDMNFPGVMADTADKLAGSLFDCVPVPSLQRFVGAVRKSGKLVGLAGALRTSHLAQLLQLAPDFAGFRSAVCVGDRNSELSPARLRDLATSLNHTAPRSLKAATWSSS